MSILFQILLIVTLGYCSQPIIQIRNMKDIYEGGWKNTTLKLFPKSKVLYHERLGAKLELICTASHPIQWKLYGHNVRTDTFKVSYPFHKSSTNYYQIVLYQIDRLLITKGVSMRVACEEYSEPRNADQVFIFVRGGASSSFVKTTSPWYNSSILPCATKDPIETVELWKQIGNGKYSLVDDTMIEFDPTVGFSSNTPFNGAFECRQGSSDLQIEARAFEPENGNSFWFAPVTTAITAFTDEQIRLHCHWPESSGNVQFQYTKPRLHLREHIANKTKVAVVSSKSNSNEPVFSDIVSCISPDGIVLKTWNITFLEPPELINAVNGKELFCKSRVSKPRMLSLVCEFSSSCDFFTPCFDDKTLCPQMMLESDAIISENDTLCDSRKGVKTFCTKMSLRQYDHAVECTVGGLSRRWTYFVSLERKIYTDWHDAPTSELVRFSEVPEAPVLYTNGTYRFTCTSIRYLFSWPLTFQLEFENGTKRYLKDGDESVQVEEDYRYGNFIIGQQYTLSIRLPHEAVGLHCLASWINNSDTMNASKYFTTQRGVNPTFADEGSEPKTIFGFTVGDTNRKLVCPAQGDPAPTYTWYFKGQEYWKSFPNLTTSVNEKGFGFLEFPEVNLHLVREFICIASNELGEISRSFTVEVQGKDLKIPTKPTFTDEGSTPETTHRFTVGDINRKLVCPAQGVPAPTYTWRIYDQEYSKVFPRLRPSVNALGFGYLEFPEVDLYPYGEIICIASNTWGGIRRSFTVEVQEVKPMSKGLIATLVVVPSLFIAALVLLVLYKLKHKSARDVLRSLTDSELHEFFKGRPDLLTSGQNASLDCVDFLPYKAELEIPLELLKLDLSESGLLGSGHFAMVVRGTIFPARTSVAVKISRSSTEISEFRAMLSEVKILMYVGDHENIIKLVGVCTENIKTRNVYIATEICGLGSLANYLRNSRNNFVSLMDANQEIIIDLDVSNDGNDVDRFSTLDLLRFSFHIANGMQYLSLKSVIHGDLAARNVLLTMNKVVKIADFGLSKRLYVNSSYMKKTKMPLPWRWMAVEALQTLTFTVKSDVWSYGATLYEIFSLGEVPFPNETWSNEFVDKLASGMRMGRPQYCSKDVYAFMSGCWETQPEMRPDFPTCMEYFQSLFQKLENGKEPTPPESHLSTNILAKNRTKTQQGEQVSEYIELIPLDNIYSNCRSEQI